MTDRLFVYGSLAPGRLNAHVLADLAGSWEAATVRGRLVQQGWGAAVGFPAIVVDESAGQVPGMVFSSEELNEHWDRLDRFEGEGYERVLSSIKLADGQTIVAYIYVLSGRSAVSDPTP